LAIRTDNEDGSCRLAIADKGRYFQDVANEIQKNHLYYSDVKIVSKDGSKFSANKAILSRCKRFSNYIEKLDLSKEERECQTSIINKH